MLFPVVKAIAQHVINVSVLNVLTAAIQNPQNNTFQLQMTGFVSHTGIISARIQFTEPLDVFWLEPDGALTHLGQIDNFPDIHSAHKTATINATAPFNITNEADFGRFTSFMITQPTFKWRLLSNSLKVHALKFPVANGIHFNKTIELNGINNFGGGHVELIDFKVRFFHFDGVSSSHGWVSCRKMTLLVVSVSAQPRC